MGRIASTSIDLLTCDACDDTHQVRIELTSGPVEHGTVTVHSHFPDSEQIAADVRTWCEQHAGPFTNHQPQIGSLAA